MLFVSCRRDRLNDRDFTARNEHAAFEVSTEEILARIDETDAHDEALIQAGNNAQAVTLAECSERAEGRHVLVLVHGYRNPFPNVARAYARLEQKLVQHGILGPLGYGMIYAYLWPGRRLRTEFFLAVPSANRAGAQHLPAFLDELCRSARSVDIQTHSLGARVGLGALRLGGDTFDGKIDNVMLTAAAVDDESVEKDKEFFEALDACKRLFNYSSNNDKVLSISYRLGDAPEFDAALGKKGTEHPDRLATHSPNAHMIDCSAIVESHGGYREADPYYQHWIKVVKETDALPQFDKIAEAAAGVPAGGN